MLLLIGADSREDSYVYGLADVIRLVRVDFRAPRLSVLAIPRDLWVDIPGIADHYGITDGKINQAYLYGGEGMGYYNGPGGGPGLLAQTLEYNYGVKVDRYLAVNMVTFVKVIDALDGIKVVLPQAVDGRPARGGGRDQFFPAGEQHLDGEEALRLVRLRTNYNDLVRSQHQDLVLEALRVKLLSPALVSALPELVEAFSGSIVTDLKLRDIVELLCLAPQIDDRNLIFAQIPPDMLVLGREVSVQLDGSVSVFKADPEALSALLAGFQAGIWP
jgi:LCP family protein required for cell wall assembly